MSSARCSPRAGGCGRPCGQRPGSPWAFSSHTGWSSSSPSPECSENDHPAHTLSRGWMGAEAAMARIAWLVDCGRMPYPDAWALQRALVAARQVDRIEDVILLVEHPPVITIGRGGRAANILVSRDAL